MTAPDSLFSRHADRFWALALAVTAARDHDYSGPYEYRPVNTGERFRFAERGRGEFGKGEG
ncbi:MAG: hypothetical protein LBI87_09525 [Candidatus Accumulibacter sp.]|jgi:hypothetical protein|nr:hypothetical protein [Accumulibacter sp.]